jgi:glycosyltransferase involved in cell wall biosynthesis
MAEEEHGMAWKGAVVMLEAWQRAWQARTMAAILVDQRWIGPHGIGRFAGEVLARLPGIAPVPERWPLLHPLDPLVLAWLLRRVRPRVYFSPGFNPPLWSSVPVVFTIHDLIHICCPETVDLAKQAYYRLLVRPAARRAHRVLTVSTYTQQAIVAWAGLPAEQVVVVGNGVGPAFRSVGQRHAPGYPYVLYVGNRKPHKNLARLFQGFAHSGLSPDLRLVLTGVPTAETDTHLATLRLTERVVYAGQLTDAELAAYYRGALVLVLPSLFEGFGLSALEAMACGTPVLTSQAAALPEVVEDAAVLIDPYDVEAIAWGLQRVVEDSALRQELSHKGLARAKQFTWEQTAARVWQVLQEAAPGLDVVSY